MNCPLSDKGCGGCRDLEQVYGDTLKKKEETVRKLFPECEKILGAEHPTHYRNKVLRSFANGRESLYAGFYREGTHQILSVKTCLLEDEIASRVAFDAAELLGKLGCGAYREDFHKGTVRHMVVRRAQRSGECLLTVVTGTDKFEAGPEFASRITRKYPFIKGVMQNINPRDSSAVLGFRDRVLWGKDEIWDEMCGLDVCLNSRAFYQVNTPQAEKLYDIAVKAADIRKEDRVLDAYCGVGVIGMCAALRAGKVTGIEVVKPAVECARRAAGKNGMENIDFICGDVIESLRAPRDHYNCVFVDPPRAGCSTEFITALSDHAPERIVYISCYPDTLKRDTDLLRKAGYAVRTVRPVDMFPYTGHVETVVLLVRKTPDAYVRIKMDMEDFDLTKPETKATYEEIKAYVKEQTGLNVTHLDIAQTKRMSGIIERENYNLPKSADAKQPQCTKEKEDAILKALKHFQMIQ